jgi:8-oxo-dGTP pyrophosphatase MutT (NUDIX family)
MSREPIYAAGGVLMRHSSSGPQVVVVHRPRYGGDWTLPKGKLKPGEPWEAAALREVHEETGYRATITSFAGPITYLADGTLKIVRFWNMRVDHETSFRPSKEVDAFEWLSPAAAHARLTYADERQLLADMFPNLALRSCVATIER